MERISRKVLCVEDHAVTGDLLTSLFTREGYEVTTTSSIAEGLQLAMAHGFDLILLDWVLRDGKGIELCRALRSIGHTAPVLFWAEPDIPNQRLDEALQAGALGFLTKPIEVENIFPKVSRFMRNLDGHSVLDVHPVHDVDS